MRIHGDVLPTLQGPRKYKSWGHLKAIRLSGIGLEMRIIIISASCSFRSFAEVIDFAPMSITRNFPYVWAS